MPSTKEAQENQKESSLKNVLVNYKTEKLKRRNKLKITKYTYLPKSV